MWWNCHYLFNEREYSASWISTDYNFWIVMLVLLLYLIIQSVRVSYAFRVNILFFLLFFILQVSNWLTFYFMYEIVFVFIIFVIIALGYRYERLAALYLIICYSFFFSRPCLIVLVLIDQVFLIKNWLCYSSWLLWFLILSFRVKFPIFGFHYWLPVAHVEASTLGSILLAGILLKLGGIGVYYLVIMWAVIIKFHWLVIRILLVILLILNISDLKIIIAYSSIAHMSFVFYVIIIGRCRGKKGALIIIFYHGFISPLMFWVVGMFAWWKTRSLLVIKFIKISYLLILFIFILCLINIRFPPFRGFLREVLILKAVYVFKNVVWLAGMAVLFSCYYNIYLLWAFIGVQGWLYKVYFSQLDVFLFFLLAIFMNFY